MRTAGGNSAASLCHRRATGASRSASFRISIVGAQQNVARAKAEAEQARIELQNTTTLTRGQIVSPNAQKMAKAKLNAAWQIINWHRFKHGYA